MTLSRQIKNSISFSLYDKKIMSKFRQRIQLGNLAKAEDEKNHFCVYFLAYDPKIKEVFIGHHRKSGLWLFTGGHIEKGESLEGAVVREVLEEWGQSMPESEVGNPSLLTITEINNPTYQTCIKHYDIWYFFAVNKDEFKMNQNKLNKEFYEIGWRGFIDAEKLIIDPSTLKALKIIKGNG